MIDTPKLGASLLAAGPVLIQFGASKAAWWAGLAFTVLGPFLMAWRRKRKET